MVKYRGMDCELYEHYFTDDDGPYLRITSPRDIEKAYKCGFECMGYPDEVMKEISRADFDAFKKTDKEKKV